MNKILLSECILKYKNGYGSYQTITIQLFHAYEIGEFILQEVNEDNTRVENQVFYQIFDRANEAFTRRVKGTL